MPRPRSTYTAEFKLRAVMMVAEQKLSVAEVARQVDSAVRYAVRRATALEVGRLTIHVGGVRFGLDSTPPVGHPAPEAIGPRDRGDSGTDVA